MGFVGVNVTLPHKEEALRIADRVSDQATLIGAANTLNFGPDGQIYADNTDGYGFIENLRQGAPDWDPAAGPAVVFGAGGAARAVVASLLQQGGARDHPDQPHPRPRRKKLQSDFGAKVRVEDWVQAGNLVEEAALLVNTTSLGMVGKSPLRVPLDGLRKGTVVTDLVYTPLKTQLLQVAEEAGCITVDGLGMLLHQAVPGFERWFGLRPTVDKATRAAALR
ncbi:shikimate dehydrogenase [Jhaorihella thermophila]